MSRSGADRRRCESLSDIGGKGHKKTEPLSSVLKVVVEGGLEPPRLSAHVP